MNFSLFYNFSQSNDLLTILFSDDEVDYEESKNDFVILKHKEDIVGYKIFNISRIIKIKAEGLIVLPPDALIDAINAILSQNGERKLSYIHHSGFLIGQVIEKIDIINHPYLYMVDIGKKEYLVALAKKNDISLKTKIVIVKNGTMLFDNSRIDVSLIRGTKCDGMICSLKDLKMENSDETLFIYDDSPLGSDFFISEVK